MPKITIAALRKKYPHPRRSINPCYGDYCVGGALCQEAGIDRNFPDSEFIRDALLKVSPEINWHELSDDHREHIRDLLTETIGANDAGNFRLAWKLLGRALRWEKPKAGAAEQERGAE